MALYGYIRVSTQHQVQSGLGLAAQRRKIEDCAKSTGIKLARIFRDGGVSASRYALTQRPAGRDLDGALQEGDHVAIAKLDRAFRGLRDFAATLEGWHKRGIKVHILDIGVDTSTPVGGLIAGIVATVAEWESRRLGERIKDAHAERRRKGMKTNGTVAIGFLAVRKYVKPAPEERTLARLMLALRGRGQTYIEIAKHLNAKQIRRRNSKAWTRNSVMRWATAARFKFPITGYHGVLENRRRNRSR